MRPLLVVLLLGLLGCEKTIVEGYPTLDERDASTDATAARFWTCGDSSEGCLCELVDPEVCFGDCPGIFGADVPYCRPYEQCRALSDSRCFCGFVDPNDPKTEGRLVPSCPPDDSVVAASKKCAVQGDPCSIEALSDANAGSCCDGQVCDLDAAGTLRCREASATDVAAELACRRAASTWPLSAMSTHDSVVTNRGTIPLGSVSTSVVFGANGAITEMMVHLFGTNGQSCDVSITASAQGSDPNQLTVTAAFVRGFPCGLDSHEDFRTDDATVLNGTVTVTPHLHCEGRPLGRCLSASFSIAITGGVPSASGNEGLAFLNPIGIEGSLCAHF
ncbi:MAG TPA: hypothetical protein VI299_07750 [Polyangiales bacterium]